MDDLSHWDFADCFTGQEVAHLVLGIDPQYPFHGEEDARVWPILRRLRNDYRRAHSDCLFATLSKLKSTAYRNDDDMFHALGSLEMGRRFDYSIFFDDFEEGRKEFLQWLEDKELSSFDFQHFGRQQIVEWLTCNKLKSVYKFNRNEQLDYIDPSELPEELAAANLAFRAVKNGYGSTSKTFKGRLEEYLRATYPGMTPTTVSNIATIANPDKSPGRKKQAEE